MHRLVLAAVGLMALMAPAPDLTAQVTDSLSLQELLLGRRLESAGPPGPGDTIPVASTRGRRITAGETLQHASADFDLATWLEARRRFLDRVRGEFDHGAAGEPARRSFLNGDGDGAFDVPRPGPWSGEPDVEVDGLVRQMMAREQLLLDLLVRLDARLERLEDVAGTLPAGLSNEELRRLIEQFGPFGRER